MTPQASALARRDYGLTGPDARRAVDAGLVSATWYKCRISRARLQMLMARSDHPALRDTLIWLVPLALSGAGGVWFWGTWWCIPCFCVYGVLYGSASDARWHECSHGTAFRTRWLNDALYQIA